MTKKLIQHGLAFALFALSTASMAGTLADARQAYATRLTVSAKAPQDFAALRTPAGVKEVGYQSGPLQLKAWLSTSAPATKLAPAVVFLHGGFSFGEEDWDAAKALVDAGYILLMPRLRGENGNPGNFELFGGEVDDAIAAGRYLAAVPGVDKDRIFVMGHSVGGSLAVLVAQMPSPFKASVSLSGYPRLLEWIDHFRIIPFDKNNEMERKIRNPYLYTDSVKTPLYLFSESNNPGMKAANAEFCTLVAKTSVCRHEVVSGNHETMMAPAIGKALALLATIK
ncbi:alpha/beta hydrolase family protein [Massilia genomosp. 1]|nr:alpha/beta fold hydrolase [Massilia genomosp. 1]